MSQKRSLSPVQQTKIRKKIRSEEAEEKVFLDDLVVQNCLSKLMFVERTRYESVSRRTASNLKALYHRRMSLGIESCLGNAEYYLVDLRRRRVKQLRKIKRRKELCVPIKKLQIALSYILSRYKCFHRLKLVVFENEATEIVSSAVYCRRPLKMRSLEFHGNEKSCSSLISLFQSLSPLLKEFIVFSEGLRHKDTDSYRFWDVVKNCKRLRKLSLWPVSARVSDSFMSVIAKVDTFKIWLKGGELPQDSQSGVVQMLRAIPKNATFKVDSEVGNLPECLQSIHFWFDRAEETAKTVHLCLRLIRGSVEKLNHILMQAIIGTANLKKFQIDRVHNLTTLRGQHAKVLLSLCGPNGEQPLIVFESYF